LNEISKSCTVSQDVEATHRKRVPEKRDIERLVAKYAGAAGLEGVTPYTQQTVERLN